MIIELLVDQQMGQELVDCRTKVSERVRQVITAHAQARGCDKSEVVREVLEEWAERQRRAATVLKNLEQREGGVGEPEGMRGRQAA